MSLLAQYQKASHREVLEARLRVSMQSPEHLITWLRESGREYLHLKASDLVHAIGLSGIPTLQVLLVDYHRFRQKSPSGETETIKLDDIGELAEVKLGKTDQLTPAEALEAAQHLLNFVNATNARRGTPSSWNIAGEGP